MGKDCSIYKIFMFETCKINYCNRIISYCSLEWFLFPALYSDYLSKAYFFLRIDKCHLKLALLLVWMYYLSDKMSQLVCSVSNQRTSSCSIATLVVFIFSFRKLQLLLFMLLLQKILFPSKKKTWCHAKSCLEGAK